MDYYKEVWVVIAISWFLIALATFVFLYWLPNREKGTRDVKAFVVCSEANIKKLSTILIGMVIIMHFAAESWDWFTDLIYEPAGNPVQMFVMDAPLWLRRVFFGYTDYFIRPPYEVFWVAIALRIFAKRAE